MQIRLTNLEIRVVAGGQRFGADLRFKDGLNLIRADNSAGKSTCMNAVMWALGLEGMLGPQQTAPLPHALTSQIEAPNGTKHAVTESHVTLEVQRSDGAYLTVRRQVTGRQIDKRLVNTWQGPVVSNPALYYPRRDYYVRRPGAAREERGFHRFLTDWCGWIMPEVPRFDGSTVPLYVEAVAPLWIVEQKRGWAGVQALTPTYLKISDVRKRAMEHVLALDVLSRRTRIQELRQALNDLRREWDRKLTEFTVTARQAGASAQRLPQHPTGDWPPTPEPTVLISKRNKWLTLRMAVHEVRERIDRLSRRSRSREVANSELSAELDTTEEELELAMAASAQLRRSIALDRESVQEAERHLAALKQDKRRHRDLLLLRRMGSHDESLLQTELCPVCNRDLGDVLLDEDSRDRAMGVEETINHLDAQAELTKAVLRSSSASLEAREAQLKALVYRSRDLRSRISALRSSLTGDGPSYADAEALLTARRQVELYEETENAFAILCEDLSEISQSWRTAQAELKTLRSQDLSDEDQRKLRILENEFLGHLSSYRYSSLPIDSMGISNDTYQPIHEGYDPAFESSASDVIRIIWAYLLSVQHVSDSLGLNHPGVVIFDEPRQQMADKISFGELLQRAATIGGQVVFATSESHKNLVRMIDELEPNILSYEGKILKPLHE